MTVTSIAVATLFSCRSRTDATMGIESFEFSDGMLNPFVRDAGVEGMSEAVIGA